MEVEDEPSQTSQEHNGPKVNNKRIEAKGTCLKIEGKDGYVLKSYSITPHGTSEPPSPLKDSSSSVEVTEEDTSQGDGLSTAETCEKLNSQSSPALSTKSQSAEVNNSSEMESIRAESNEAGEITQDDEKLSFDGAFGPFATRGYDEEDYGSLFSGYSSTLYDVAMDAVTQSLLTSIRSPINPRKKSPAWNHFFISPRDGTKAICMYCMKEFSRGKNEKDLSTSCLMRHVRRAHPTVLLQDGDSLNNSSNTSSSLIPPNTSPNHRDKRPADGHSLLSTETVSKESLQKIKPKAEKSVKGESGTASSPHSFNNHNDDAVDLGTDPGSAPKSSRSRRRSAVWKHFYLSPADSSKAVCIHCMNEFSRGKNGKDLGTSCLIRHMWRAHRDIVIEENGQGSSIPPPYTTPPTLLSRAAVQDEVKKELSCTSYPPETISDDVPNDDGEHMTAEEEANDATYQTEQESDPDASFRLKEENVSLTSSPEEHAEGQSLSPEPSSVFQQNKKIMKRVKSEVWHHFIVSPVDQLKALCRYCPCVISRGKRGDFGTSCLMRHLMRRHADVLKTQKSTSDRVYSPQSPHTTPAAEDDTLTHAADTENKPHTLPAFSKKTSKLWNHFNISSADPTKVVCLHCSRTISRGKKTTNLGTSCLYRHMQRFHGHVLENNSSISGEVSSAEVQVKQELMEISTYGENTETLSECHPIAKKITKLIAEMLALDLQPSTVVENVGLKRLLEYLQPQYSLPSSSFFTSTAIPEMYESVKEVVLTHLKEAEGGIVHFTTSVWVSSQTQEYLILTAHWVTFETRAVPQGQDFHCSALLGVSPIDCDYNMLNIQKQLEYLWDSWVASSGLKIGFTVTDNQTVEGVLENSRNTTMQCFVHNIDLIVNEAIKSQRMVQNLLSIARKICERVHRSAKAKEKLAELQKVYQLPENQLVQDVPSKWKTSYFMLERLVEQKQAVDEVSIECSFRELISCDQWEVMQSVCSALKPFEVACREMSSRTATLGQVIPLIHILNRKIDMLFDETMGIDNMLKSLKEAMVTRMSPTLHDSKYMWATMLDPRYKTSLFTEQEAEQCKQDLIQELEVLTSTSAETKPPLSNGCSEMPAPSNSLATNRDNLWALMGDVRQKIKQEERPKSSELVVMEYLEEDILDQSCDPLDYWNLKKFLWPDLAKVAVRYVGCPPSIVPADTLFSTSGVNCALSPSRPLLENLEGLLFLKVNLPLIYFQY